jgi:uncharacterized membrane protein YphA (DoxX/SURF4 family)
MTEPEPISLAEQKVAASAAPLTGSDGPAHRGLVALRLGIGLVWAVNLIFIFDPQNHFFSTFASTASSFSSVSLGGTGFPAFVASHPALFSVLIAGVTLYLAVAFLLGLTTRLACGVGAGFAIALLVSQWGATFVIPGGTDVGPMPIYLGVYLALAVGHAGRYFSLDAVIAARWAGRKSRLRPRSGGSKRPHPARSA